MTDALDERLVDLYLFMVDEIITNPDVDDRQKNFLKMIRNEGGERLGMKKALSRGLLELGAQLHCIASGCHVEALGKHVRTYSVHGEPCTHTCA